MSKSVRTKAVSVGRFPAIWISTFDKVPSAKEIKAKKKLLEDDLQGKFKKGRQSKFFKMHVSLRPSQNPKRFFLEAFITDIKTGLRGDLNGGGGGVTPPTPPSPAPPKL